MFSMLLGFTKYWKVFAVALLCLSVFGAGWKSSAWRSDAAMLKTVERHQAQMEKQRRKLLAEYEQRAAKDMAERARLAIAVVQLRDRENELNSQIDALVTPDCADHLVTDEFIRLWNAPVQ